MLTLCGARKQLAESLHEAEELGADVLSQEQDEEIDTYNHAIRIDELEEHDDMRSQYDRDVEPLRMPIVMDKKIKLKDGVVEKASEGIIEASTRQEYKRHV